MDETAGSIDTHSGSASGEIDGNGGAQTTADAVEDTHIATVAELTIEGLPPAVNRCIVEQCACMSIS